jgi:hypothetical protein
MLTNLLYEPRSKAAELRFKTKALRTVLGRMPHRSAEIAVLR